MPDGVVINKLKGGDSPFVEGYVQADMGQLYNIAVQGSAVCKSFKSLAYDMQHKTSPRDDMFVTLSVVSESNLILVGKGARFWNTDAAKTEKEYETALGESFVAEMVNVMVAEGLSDDYSGGANPLYAYQTIGDYEGRNKKQRVGRDAALPGRYNLNARQVEFDVDLRGTRHGNAAKDKSSKAMRDSAGCRDATNSGAVPADLKLSLIHI